MLRQDVGILPKDKAKGLKPEDLESKVAGGAFGERGGGRGRAVGWGGKLIGLFLPFSPAWVLYG